MHITFVRHGETMGNREQIAHGQSESPLTDAGRQQARHTAELLAGSERPFDYIYASPLSRADETAQIIAERLGLRVRLDPGLMEGHLGILEGVSYRELEAFGFPRRAIADDHFDAHQGESPFALATRVTAALGEIRARHHGRRVIVVSHGTAISHALACLNGETPLFGPQYIMHNGAISELDFHDRPRLGRINVYAHIPESLRTAPPRRARRSTR